jgi:cytochrome c oxidase subunit 2
MCSEYCGVGHAQMLAKLKVVPQADYEAWLKQESE